MGWLLAFVQRAAVQMTLRVTDLRCDFHPEAPGPETGAQEAPTEMHSSPEGSGPQRGGHDDGQRGAQAQPQARAAHAALLEAPEVEESADRDVRPNRGSLQAEPLWRPISLTCEEISAFSAGLDWQPNLLVSTASPPAPALSPPVSHCAAASGSTVYGRCTRGLAGKPEAAGIVAFLQGPHMIA